MKCHCQCCCCMHAAAAAAAADDDDDDDDILCYSNSVDRHILASPNILGNFK